MESQNNTMSQKPKSCLPTIALIFGIYPMCVLPIFGWLLQTPILGVLATLFIVSIFGIILTIIGFLLGIVALLCRKKRHISARGLIFSIIAVLSPFIWNFILFYFGAMDYIMTYK